MSCSPVDLKDYFFGELAEAERLRMKEHVAGCSSCRSEVERLRLTQSALSSLRDEEPPRRIAFVSDKVFEPRWWQRVWRSGPQLGFLSASILAAAILVHGWTRPAPVITPVSAGVSEAEVARRIQTAVKESEARQAVKTAELLAAAEKNYEFDRKALLLAVQQDLDLLEKQFKRAVQIASNQSGRAE